MRDLRYKLNEKRDNDRYRSPVRRERYWSSPQRKDLDEKLHKDEKKEIKFYNDKQNDKQYRNFEKEGGGYMPYRFMPQAFMPPGFPMGLPMNIPVGYPPGFPQYPMQNFNPRLYYGPPPDEEPPAPRSLPPPLETIKKSR